VHDRDLIVGVVAAQAGFATPSEVLAAAAVGLVNPCAESLLTRLERSGTLSAERRRILEAMVEQALVARNGDAHAVLTSLGAAPAVIETLVSAVGAMQGGATGQPGVCSAVPLERPGQYIRLGELGRGSQSIVRVARDEFVGREVALKELVTPSSPSGDEASRAARARFLREARLVAGLDHPGIVSILELARRDDGTLFCAQKLIRGETLQVRLACCRTSGDRLELLRHVLDACQAMGFAHSKRVIHRDLKPSNIMVGGYGETVVVDWGLAKHRDETDEIAPLLGAAAQPLLTVAGVALGTPAYMSPEQARGDLPAIDARSDVFSLGAILYQVLTGRLPFEGVSPEHILENVREGRFPPVLTISPEAPPELAAIAEHALQPEPSKRYRDAEELATELSAYLAGGRVRAYQYGTWELLRKFASSHRAILTGVAIGAAALLVAAVVVAVRLHRTRVDLASAFVQRAYGAEQEGDWSKAAAYFAAARVQHDTTEKRWGLAVASEQMTERILSLHGPAESFTDVGVLPDGRVIALGRALARVEIREAESGKTLWTHSGEPVLDAVLLSGGLLRLSRSGGWVFLDAATGRELQAWPRSSGSPCPGPYPPRAFVLNGQLLHRQNGGETRVVASDVSPFEICVVSDDGLQVAYEDASEGLRLVALDDGRELARRKFEPFQSLHFSRHGLVVVRQGRLDVLGGRDGDFSIELPAAKFGTWGPQVPLGGSAVSPDGELVAVAGREGATQSMVVDLRSRSIRAVLHYPSGWPRLAFSLDGQRIFAAGMNNASVLSGWRVPPDRTPKTPRWWSLGFQSSSGRAAVLFELVSGRFELYKPAGTLFASGVRSFGWGKPRLVGEGPAVAFMTSDDRVILDDLEKDRVLWQHPCRICRDISVSEDGSRFAMSGADGLEVWDTRADRRIFQETRRMRLAATECTLSRDGRHLAWTFVDTLIVRDLDSGKELEFPLDGANLGLCFSPDMARLVTVTTRSTALRDTETGRTIWNVANDLPDRVDLIFWSPDGRALLLLHGWSATEVLDVGTGERLAWFQALNRAVTPVRAELYTPDLRLKSVAAEKTWDTRPVPQPDETPAAESLARTLQKTGLAFRGVEVVAAP
jgi:tRNA A-37 threonylcarbamoyl transferase component Bud32/WD40 repeat protein